MTNEERKEEILVASPVPMDSKQYAFEQRMLDLGVWSGCCGFSPRDNRYFNEHVQWAWEQFQAKD